jgi:hypothetical protein
MLWHRDERLPPSAPTRSPVVPGSDALRQAALEASWRRDRKVAQRRIAWRWVVWCLQRYSLPVLGGLGAMGLVIYVAGLWPQEPAVPSSHAVTAPERQTSGGAPSAPAPSETTTVMTTPAEDPSDQAPLRLRGSVLLNDARATSLPDSVAPVSADTLSLKPETWLHSKEP